MHISFLKNIITISCFIVLLAYNNSIYGQDSINIPAPDTSQILNTQDTSKISKKTKKSEIEDPVKYSARDSFTFDMPNKKIYLYGDAVVTYQNIELKANYIEFNMGDETVYAQGTPDSTGTIIGKPEFKEGTETFKADWLRYNFKTKKGFINVVITKQQEGTLIGDSTKRIANGDIFLKGGKYSTCDLPHPHFYLALTKAKAVPNDKIVSGPAYLVLADIPLPLILPFGFFPNTKGIKSGLLAPTWGEERNGYYLRDGGYYFAFNDYIDATIRGNIYSNSSWGANTLMHYKKRYKFAGTFDFQYNVTVTGEKGLKGYSRDKDYGINWTHIQDAKANPNNTFSASVRIASRLNDKRNSYVTQDYLSTSKSSSINYSHSWPNSPFRFNSSFTHSQNNRTKTVDMTLPQMSFEMSPIKPFMPEDIPLKPKWYQKIEIRYDASLTNNVRTYDSLLFTNRTFENINNGFQQRFVPNINFRLHELTNTSLTPSISYEGVLFTRHQTLEWDIAKNKVDTVGGLEKGLYYTHAIRPSISLGTSPMFFGMYTFRNSKIKAIRHTISPQISFSATPDIRSFWPNYYGSYMRDGKKVLYPKYVGTYNTPIPASGKSASISFGLSNRLEMKYISENDTSSTEKKVNLLDHFNITGGYDLIADSNNLSNIGLSASTNLFKKLDISFSGQLDPYAVDSFGRRLRHYEWWSSNHKRLARMTSASVTISTDFSSQGDNENKNENPQNTPANISEAGAAAPTNAEDVNYNIPWTLRLNYTWGFNGWASRRTYDHSVGFSGSLAVTKKWNVTYSSNYDFVGKALGFTNISINRDLHCWQMSFHWVPFGYAARYSFTINVKASILKDLKYTKQSDSRRNY